MSLLYVVSVGKQCLDRHLSLAKTSFLECFVFGFLLLVLLLVVKYPNRAIGTRPRPDLRGPREWPVLGYLPLALLESGQKALESQLKMFEKYDNVFTITIPGFGRFVFVNSPEAMEHIHKSK